MTILTQDIKICIDLIGAVALMIKQIMDATAPYKLIPNEVRLGANCTIRVLYNLFF